MTTLLEAARAVLRAEQQDGDRVRWETDLRAAIEAAEKAPPVVAAEEMRAILNEHGWTVSTLDTIAALVAERAAAPIAEVEQMREIARLRAREAAVVAIAGVSQAIGSAVLDALKETK